MESEIKASLVLSGRDFDPDMCTGHIGIQPSKIWTQKRKQLRLREDLPTASWTVGDEWVECDGLNEAVASVLDRVWSHHQQLQECAKRYQLKTVIECGVRIWEDAPEYTLSAATIGRMASINAELGLSIYDMTSEDDDD